MREGKILRGFQYWVEVGLRVVLHPVLHQGLGSARGTAGGAMGMKRKTI